MSYLDLKILEKTFNKSSREILALLIEQQTLTSHEVMDRLNITKQRLFALKKQNLLREVKKGVFLREEVELMRVEQLKENRLNKFNQSSSYELTPAFKVIEHNNLVINKLRFFDCLAMVRANITNPTYNNHLKILLNASYESFKNDGVVYLTNHEGFDYVETINELKEAEITIRTFTLDEFITFLTSDEAKILRMEKIKEFYSVLKSLQSL